MGTGVLTPDTAGGAARDGEREKRVDLVFEGGGVKGLGLAGALLELDAQGYEPQCVAGTSAGAITAALVAAGYRGEELKQAVLGMEFQKFADRPHFDWTGPAGKAVDVLRDHGIHSGDYFLGWMRQMLARKGVHTFADLCDKDAKAENRRYRLQVIASDLTDQSMLVLPRDAGRLGLDPGDLEVAAAVRMSMSIPIFFKPVSQVCDGRVHVMVDGGLLSNFPVWLFDVPAGTPPAFPTLGLLLVSPGQRDPLIATPPTDAERAATRSILGYLKSLADTAMQAHDRFYVEDEDFARTIAIPTLGVKTTDFDIDPHTRDALLQSGRTAAASFLASWDFRAYVERYRAGTVGAAR